MQTLVVIPTQAELAAFVASFPSVSPRQERAQGLVPLVEFVKPRLSVALGGLGKVQFAVRCQYLLDRGLWSRLICVGAAGGLVPGLAHGDVVIGTETVEHDIRKVGGPLVPRYQANPELLASCRAALSERGVGFNVQYGPIASGDEDIVDATVRANLATRTGGLAVAWEGAGAGAACLFSGIPFLEVRGIADSADHNGPDDFKRNLNAVMANVAFVISAVADALAE